MYIVNLIIPSKSSGPLTVSEDLSLVYVPACLVGCAKLESEDEPSQYTDMVGADTLNIEDVHRSQGQKNAEKV